MSNEQGQSQEMIQTTGRRWPGFKTFEPYDLAVGFGEHSPDTITLPQSFGIEPQEQTHEAWGLSVRATYEGLAEGWNIRVSVRNSDEEAKQGNPYQIHTLSKGHALDLFNILVNQDMHFRGLQWFDKTRNRSSRAFCFIRLTAVLVGDGEWCMYAREFGPDVQDEDELGRALFESDAYAALLLLDALDLERDDWAIREYRLIEGESTPLLTNTSTTT